MIMIMIMIIILIIVIIIIIIIVIIVIIIGSWSTGLLDDTLPKTPAGLPSTKVHSG